MNALISSHRSPLNSLRWRKDFSTRRTILYHGQDNRLLVPNGESVIDEFFRSFNPDLTPPRRHELLRLFLWQTGAKSSFCEAIGDQSSPADRRILAIIDDRSDPCLRFTSIPEGAAFLPVRQWESEEYMRRPPGGLHVSVFGVDAEMLYTHLNRNVGLVLLSFPSLLRLEVSY